MGTAASDPLRILLVTSNLNWSGGIGRVVSNAAQALSARGHEVHVAGRVKRSHPTPLPGVEVHPWRPTRFKLAQLGPLLALQRSLRADVIHFHSALPHGEVILGLRLLRRAWGRPGIFVTPHTGRRAHYPKRRARLGLRCADAVLVPSRWSVERAVAVGAAPGTTHAVYAGIDLPAPRPWDQREKLVLGIGKLIRAKGFDLLIEAFCRCAEDRPGWRLEIGGDGPEMQSLRAQARATGLGDRIEFLNYVTGPAKTAALARARIGVVPSHQESFGAVLLEFQAEGLACIASRVGGMSELVDDGVSALAVPPGDANALTRVLGDLLDSPELCRRLSSGGREFAGSMTWAAAAAEYERLYRATPGGRQADS